MRPHETRASLSNLVRAPKQLRMDEINRSDVERRWNADLSAERDHALDEVEARAPKIEAAINMRRLDVEEALRPDRLGEANEQPHRKGGAAAMRACENVLIEARKIERHARTMRSGVASDPQYASQHAGRHGSFACALRRQSHVEGRDQRAAARDLP